MVLKISCLFPARLAAPNYGHDADRVPGDPPRPRANTAPSDRPSALCVPNGGIDESPNRTLAPPVRQKRSSFTFFAFSSKRRSPRLQQGPAPPHAYLVSPTAVPSPLRADDDEYYYSYAASLAHSSLPASPVLDQSRAQVQHPYAYSAHLDPGPRLRHVSSQPFRLHLQDASTAESSHPGPHLAQPELKTSMSTPNLALHQRSLLRKKPPPRPKERWLSAESWWDALFSPSPRFKVKRAPRPSVPPSDPILNSPVGCPVQVDPGKHLGVTFPSLPVVRPRAVSAASATSSSKHTVHSLTRSRSAVDLSGGLPQSRAGFEPALEPLVDQPTPPERPSAELALPEPPLSLEEVLTQGEVFEQQRALWKRQASKSLGNKHTRSFSRARSKSLGERHARLGRRGSDSSKAHLEFLAARTLLGSQVTMPVVHVTKPSSSSSHSKAYSHSHSQSAYSHSHSSHSRAYSHSHSHSLTTSNSSKSSRHNPPRTHSRNGSWGKTALLRAGALCGFTQDDASATDEKVPSSSRVDVQGTIVIGHSTNAEPSKVSPSPSDPGGEVGIAISPSPALDGSFPPGPPRQEVVHDGRSPSKHTHKSSEYAGPHPSAIDTNLPPLGVASDVSLRHRLPPRAIHPPIAPMAHPYRAATVRVANDGSRGAVSKVTEQEAVEPARSRNPYLSLSHADFEHYGVGEALVYASLPRPEAPPDAMTDATSPATEQSLSSSTDIQGRDESSIMMHSVPSLTNSTIQMVMSAFNSPDDLDEFQDLFYKPLPGSDGLRRELSVPASQVPTDVHSSASSSPLTHLVRKLSEEVHSMRRPSRTPSDPMRIQRSDSQEHHTNEGATKFVFMDVARRSSSPPPMESSSQLQLPIEEGNESMMPPILTIPEDVHSSYTSSVLESPLEDCENDTFGYPIKHGQLEVATAPTPIRSPLRTSTHASIQVDDAESQTDDDDGGGGGGEVFLEPPTKRYGLVSIDAVRASYLTTSDLSQMSGLSDFPLPPGARPVTILHAYNEATPSSSEGGHEEEEATETGHAKGDVGETLRALRTPRVASYQSRRSTFGGSDDMDYIVELHQAGP